MMVRLSVPWTAEDDDRLRKLAAESRPVKVIAERLKRSESSVRGRAAKLKLLVAMAKK